MKRNLPIIAAIAAVAVLVFSTFAATIYPGGGTGTGSVTNLVGSPNIQIVGQAVVLTNRIIVTNSSLYMPKFYGTNDPQYSDGPGFGYVKVWDYPGSTNFMYMSFLIGTNAEALRLSFDRLTEGDGAGGTGYGSIEVETLHGNPDPPSGLKSELKILTPGSIAIAPGYDGINFVGGANIQIGAGWENTLMFVMNQSNTTATSSMGVSGGIGWVAEYTKADASTHTLIPGFVAQATSVAGNGEYALHMIGEFFTNGTVYAGLSPGNKSFGPTTWGDKAISAYWSSTGQLSYVNIGTIAGASEFMGNHPTAGPHARFNSFGMALGLNTGGAQSALTIYDNSGFTAGANVLFASGALFGSTRISGSVPVQIGAYQSPPSGVYLDVVGGDVEFGQKLTVTNGITSLGSNFVTSYVSYGTNIIAPSGVIPDFSKAFSRWSTNAAFTIGAPSGVDTTKKVVQTCAVYVVNTSPAERLITPAANMHGVPFTGMYVTNLTRLTLEVLPGEYTNVFAQPIF